MGVISLTNHDEPGFGRTGFGRYDLLEGNVPYSAQDAAHWKKVRLMTRMPFMVRKETTFMEHVTQVVKHG